jgi:hypothetical protein
VIAEYRNLFEQHLNTFIREMLATYSSKEEERKLFTAVRAQVSFLFEFLNLCFAFVWSDRMNGSVMDWMVE